MKRSVNFNGNRITQSKYSNPINILNLMDRLKISPEEQKDILEDMKCVGCKDRNGENFICEEQCDNELVNGQINKEEG